MRLEPKTFTNPFPGLRPFETGEYRLFFGREGQSDALITRLQRARFLGVVGTSGSGKSSLVRAGLLPALRGGMMAGAGSGWRISIMRPGSDPFGNLAHSLAENDVLPEAGGGLPPAEAEAVIEAQLRSGSLGLVDAAKHARLAEHEKLLIVVDQFEELFRFRAARAATSTGDDASAFVKLLLEAAQQREVSLYVVLTMRSDFLGDCSQFQGLPEAINDGQYLIPRMTRDERRMAVTGPVGVTRGKMTEPLISRLLNDVGDNPDQLPILQHALMRTWDCWAAHRRNGEPIGLEHYENIGTMSDALSLHADEAWDELPDDRSRRVAEKLFKALTEKGADNREIRRPTCLSDIAAAAEVTAAEVVAVIDVFRRVGRSFLMPPAGVDLSGETVIDISHESLIRNWDRLQKWVEEEAQSARIYRRLAEAAVLHREGSEGLLQDPGLQIALDWREKSRPNAAWARRYHSDFAEAMTFLDASKAARDAAVAERERQRQEQIARERRELEQATLYAEQQRRAAVRQRRTSRVLFVVAGLALFALLFAFVAQRRAVAAQHQAESEQQKASAAQRLAEQGRREVAAALEETKAAKSEAEKSRDNAKAQAEIAKREETKAESEKKRADEEARHAQQQAAQARQAEQEAERRALALQANGKFRDATILAERGDYKGAADLYDATIKGLQKNGVNDTEGVADTYVQLGQVHFSAMQGTELTEFSNYSQTNQGIESYDQAVKHYEDAKLPMKAADTLLSVGGILLKIANDVPVGRRVSRTSEELAALALPILSPPGGVLHFEDDDNPKVKLKNQALERYKKAFLLFRQAENKEGMMKATYRIGNFYLRNELPAWQDTTPSLNVDQCRPSRALIVGNHTKALCYFRELERLTLSQGADDSRIHSLLVWIGGLNLEWNDRISEEYFTRAQQAYVHHFGSSEAIGWFNAAQVSEAAGLPDAALNLYARALDGYKKEGNYSEQALTYFRIGDLLQKRAGNSGATEEALAQFKLALDAYKQNLKSAKPSNIGGWVKEFFAIGSFAEDVSDEQTALDAYHVALALGEQRHDAEMQAHAWSSIAFIQSQNAPEVARQSYMRSFALYSKRREELSENYTGPIPEGDENLKELERISAAVLSLDREIRTKALAEQRTLGAESLCPFPVIVYAQPNATEGDTVTFSAYAANANESKLSYEWTLNSPAASITERVLKPYPAIRVETYHVGKKNLTATLVVSDGSGAAVCRQTAQATTKVAPRQRGR
jgi:hypothetical protein